MSRTDGSGWVTSQQDRQNQQTALSVLSRIRPHKYPKITTAILLWMFGLFSIFLSPAPVKITPQMERNYGLKMNEVAHVDTQLGKAYNRYLTAKLETDSAKVWFWRFRPEYREIVRERQVPEFAAKVELENLQAKQRQKLSEAKGELGIWSEAGLQEGRTLFWQSYGEGKLFAQRQSLFDAIMSLIYSRESDGLGNLITLLVICCVNFTTGMISSLIFFVFRLPGFIASFSPGVISGTLYFAVACVGAVSVIVTFLGLLYGGSVAFVYAVAGPRLERLEGGINRASRISYERRRRRPHYA